MVVVFGGRNTYCSSLTHRERRGNRFCSLSRIVKHHFTQTQKPTPKTDRRPPPGAPRGQGHGLDALAQAHQHQMGNKRVHTYITQNTHTPIDCAHTHTCTHTHTSMCNTQNTPIYTHLSIYNTQNPKPNNPKTGALPLRRGGPRPLPAARDRPRPPDQRPRPVFFLARGIRDHGSCGCLWVDVCMNGGG